MTITVILSSLYMWYTNTPDFPFGKREIRPLLIARGLGGFFGVFGLYCTLSMSMHASHVRMLRIYV